MASISNKRTLQNHKNDSLSEVQIKQIRGSEIALLQQKYEQNFSKIFPELSIKENKLKSNKKESRTEMKDLSWAFIH